MRPSGVLLLTGLSFVPALSGCGVDTYENRLKAANAYYAYREDLDTSLDRKWVGPFGVSLRVPAGFREVAAPKKDMPDDRMNSRFTRVTDLPGLLAKWEMPVQTDDAGNQVAELFLLANHQRFLDYDPQNGDGGSPATFLQDYDAALQAGLNVTMTPPSGAAADNAWLPGRVPVAGQIPYTQTKNYEWAKLAPPENPEVMPHRVGYTSRFEVPVNRNAKLQVILLCLYPARMRDSTRLIEQRLTKTMEQLEVPPQMPIKPKPGQKVGTPAPANNF